MVRASAIKFVDNIAYSHTQRKCYLEFSHALKRPRKIKKTYNRRNLKAKVFFFSVEIN